MVGRLGGLRPWPSPPPPAGHGRPGHHAGAQRGANVAGAAVPLAEDGAVPVANAMSAMPVSNAFVKPTIGGGMKADEAILASSPLATPVSDVRPAGPGLPRTVGEAFERARQRREEDALATARATQRAKSESETSDAIRNIDGALDIINSVTRRDPNTGKSILGSATGSIAGAGIDLGARLFGYPLDSANAATALETAHARLASLLPRMRGDLNKGEFESLQAQAGVLGDRTRTRQERATALVTLTEDLNRLKQRLAGDRGITTTPQRTTPAAPAEGGWSIRPVQ